MAGFAAKVLNKRANGEGGKYANGFLVHSLWHEKDIYQGILRFKYVGRRVRFGWMGRIVLQESGSLEPA
jgi:hypothetical protein